MKKVPMRMCVACRERKPKKELIRIVLLPSGLVEVDPGGKKPGRGAYICKSRTCLERALAAHRIERGLKREVAPEVLEALTQQMEEE